MGSHVLDLHHGRRLRLCDPATVLRKTIVLAIVGLLFAAAWPRTACASEADSSGDADLPRWNVGDPIPEGYRAAHDLKLAKLGGAILASSYAFDVAVYLVGVATCSSAWDGFMGGDGSATCNPAPSSPLLIPLAGPWIVLARPHIDSGTVFWLSLSGAGQAAGAGLLAYSLLLPQYKLVPREDIAVGFAPIGHGGLAMSGQF